MTSSSAALAGSATHFPMKRKIAAILAADVAGYSRLVAENEERTLTDLAAARHVFDGLVARVGGRIFNTAGDSIMVEFDSAVEALRAAVDIQAAMRAKNLGVDAKRRLEFRMGLTIGDVVERDGDLLGDGVNIAARLESLAPAGGICVSRSVHEAVSNKIAVAFRELGPRQVKNIPQPVFAYLIEPPNAGRGSAEPMVARRISAQAEPVRRRDRAPRPERERRSPGFFAIFLRSVLVTASVLAMIFLGGPMLQIARNAIESYREPTPPTPEAPAQPPVEKPPANESSAPLPPPEQPVQAERPAPAPASPVPAPAAPSPAPVPASPPARLQRAERPKQPPRPEPTRPEPARPEPAKPEPSRPETARGERPGEAAAAYAALAREGLIAEPRTLAEHYHNARFLEAKNDRQGALASYAAAAPLTGDHVDVHFRHASLLRGTRGIGAVRQVYGALVRSSPSRAAELVLALSNEGEERRAKLQAFASAHPDFVVADNLLADALLDGEPTLTDRRLAFDASERFLEAAASGELAGRFVDRAFLDGWLDGARRRRGEVEKFFASGRTRPSIAFSRIPSGWLAKLTLPEPATAIAVRVGERGTFHSTGFSTDTDPKTGKPMPNLQFEMPSSTPRVTLYVTYQDRSGREAGPFPLPSFDPGSATVDVGRSALERFPDTWVSFREDLPDVLSYAGLVSNRCALSRVVIGFGDEAPRRPLPLPPCDATGPVTMPSGASLLSLPDGTDSVKVQLVYADGSESPVRTFRRP